jgi:polygalacturonase
MSHRGPRLNTESAAALLDASSAVRCNGATGPLPWPEANKILCEVVPPSFPNTTCKVTDYGAVADGTTDNTDAFKKAIRACAQKGGGHVEVPAGEYVSGAIELLDEIDLHLDAGSTITFSGDPTKYPLVLTRNQGIELMNHSPAIYAYGRTNVALTGQGVLDDAGTATFNKGFCNAAWSTIQGWGDSGFLPVSKRLLPAGQSIRESFVEFYACKNVLIQGVSLKNAQFWQTHIVLSSNVTVDGITEDASNGNTDCFDPESSDHVVLKNSHLSCHDDCIAIKSGRDNDGRRVNVPTSNVVLMDTSCATPFGLITLGSEESAGIQNVYAYNLTTHQSAFYNGVNHLVEMRANQARGGGAININVDTVHNAHVRSAVVAENTSYNAGGCNSKVGNVTPIFDDLTFRHIEITGASQVLDLIGVGGHPTNVTISDSTFSNIRNATSTISNANVTYKHVTVNGVAQ